MPRPGVDVVISEPAPTGGAILDTGQGFFVGVSERGPVDAAVSCRSLKEYERRYGGRSGGQVIHDSVRAFFTERASTLWFARLSGPTAAAATATVGVVQASASSPGLWGNGITVAFEAPTGLAAQAREARKPNRRHAAKNGNGDKVEALAPGDPVRCVVTYGDVVERSQDLTTAQDAVDWSATSNYVRITSATPDQALDVVAAVPLVGGTDDAAVSPAEVGSALDLFDYAKGPGQVSYPGCTDVTIHAVVLDHCLKNKRVALLDLNDEDDVTLASDVTALHAYDGSRVAQALAPRIVYPGPASGTTILVPYSAVQAGIIARQDRITGNPNEPAAGTNGQSIGARGLAREFTDDVREQLNELGVTFAKVIYGNVRTYGSRTCAGPDQPDWRWFANSRVVMAIGHDCDAAAENYVHKQIDAKRKIFTSLEQDLGGVCLHYMTLDALWAFRIDTGPQVNTDDTVAAGEIHATVGVQTSPSAEWVLIEISKYPLSQPA